VLSAGERQALEWMQKARQWIEAAQVTVDAYEELRGSAQAILAQAEVKLANRSRIIAIPANPNTARGYSANLVLDEFGHHEKPNEIWRAIYPSISNPLKGDLCLRIVGTPNGRGNKLYQVWTDDNGYSKHKVTIHDAAAAGLPVDVAALKKALGDPEGWAQEYECEFIDATSVLLPYDLIASCESDAATTLADTEWRPEGEAYVGIDIGRRKDLTVCWTLEKVGDVLWTREVLVVRAVDTGGQEALLRLRMQAAARAAYDYTGPGIGLGDLLAREHGEWRPAAHRFGPVELCTFTAPFKREIFPRLRRAFESGKIRVPISRAVREDLHAMQQTVRNGEYNYWAPRTREGHSDICTAYALAVRAAGEDGRGALGIW
jgi:phage FluMu gp28-like protein